MGEFSNLNKSHTQRSLERASSAYKEKNKRFYNKDGSVKKDAGENLNKERMRKSSGQSTRDDGRTISGEDSAFADSSGRIDKGSSSSSRGTIVTRFTRDPETGKVVDTLQGLDAESKQKVIEASQRGRVQVTAAQRDEAGRLRASSVSVKEKENTFFKEADKNSGMSYSTSQADANRYKNIQYNKEGEVVAYEDDSAKMSNARNPVSKEELHQESAKDRYVPPPDKKVDAAPDDLEKKNFFSKVKSGYKKAEEKTGEFLFAKNDGRTGLNLERTSWIKENLGADAPLFKKGNDWLISFGNLFLKNKYFKNCRISDTTLDLVLVLNRHK